MIRRLLARLFRRPAEPVTPWRVDRAGVCYLPERRVVLRARTGR